MSIPERTEKQNNAGQAGALFRRILSAIVHNWGWKLGCLVAAIFLWGALISQDASLMRTKVFNDVTVSVLNEETMMRNGYIVVSGLDSEALSGIRMRVEVPQRMYDTVQASNYNVRVDLSRIRGTGTQTLQVLTNNTATYGNVIDLSVNTIEVEVEEYVTRSRIPVRIASTGKLQDGLYAAAATADPIYVEIAGPKSQVDAVARCVVPYDLSELPYYVGTERTALPFRLEDRQENVIPQDHITVSPLNSGIQIETITVEQTFYEVVSLPVDVASLLTGLPAEGYHVESIAIDPSQVRVAFNDQIDTSAVGSLYAATPADISGLNALKTFTVALTRPSDAKYIGVTSVMVTVDIRPDQAETTETAATAAPDPEETPAPDAGEENGL